MPDLISLFKKDLYRLVLDLKKNKKIDIFDKKNLSIDYSSKSKQGDLSSNILLILIKKNLDKDFDLKNYISNYLNNLSYIEKIIIAKAGFINIFIKKEFLISKLKDIFKDSDFKKNPYTKKEKINIEFVSANPTGPIHIAHIRGAVLGDVLGSILQKIGHKVTREYYVNDAGSQITILGNSLYKRYQELCGFKINLTDIEYPGNYLINLAMEIKESDRDKWILDSESKKYFESYAVESLIKNIKFDLSLINVNFDIFTFESQIVKERIIDKVFSLLKEKDLIYEGFLNKPLGEENDNWSPRKQLLFRSTNFNDDSDRPFQKSDKSWTYFANDSAYHYNKYKRGFDKLINIWGADHIGYINRLKSIVDVISDKSGYLDIFICQIVRLIKDKKQLKMSKRDGNFVTLREIYDQVGSDALRYFMVSSKSETPMDFDMNKVIEKNKDNPVFYCQYAYVRASSVISRANNLKSINDFDKSFKAFNQSTISVYEWEIILKLLSWPYILIQAAETKEPHRITNYLEDISSSFHSFWNKGKDDISLRMINEENMNITISKLLWINIFKKVLEDAFKIIGISSPDSM